MKVSNKNIWLDKFKQKREADEKKAEVVIEKFKLVPDEVKPIRDRLGREIYNGCFFLFVDVDNRVKLGFATVISKDIRWFSEVFSIEYSILHKDEEFFRFDNFFLKKLCTLRETRLFSTIPTGSDIIILKDFSKKSNYYGRWW